jgi:GT2 family glycosyltransferase
MLSVIVPFHTNPEQLARSLRAIRTALNSSNAAGELIVVADGAEADCSELVRESGGIVLDIPGPSGPAVARNRGAGVARGDLLVFVDSDVVVAPDALSRMVEAFRADPHIAALFGAYDEDPDDPGFHSQARNLAHSFIHQRSERDATTFWSGLGVIRTSVFLAVGGFDERFIRPSVEDIDLGYRVRAVGHRIVLDHTIRGKHLKRWSLWIGLRCDVRDRGIPWTQLLHRYAAMRNDLNVSRAYRICVVVSYLAVALAIGALWLPLLAVPALACLLALVWLDRPYYAFFVRRRGFLFTARWFPVHVLHHLTNGVSFVIGTALFLLSRFGIRCPWTLPTERWQSGLLSTRAVAGAG